MATLIAMMIRKNFPIALPPQTQTQTSGNSFVPAGNLLLSKKARH
jgi:hypothetical protein